MYRRAAAVCGALGRGRKNQICRGGPVDGGGGAASPRPGVVCDATGMDRRAHRQSTMTASMGASAATPALKTEKAQEGSLF